MGGFKPSRADIAGSTTVGSNKDADVHQFTGSVDITGSLTLNGASITSGGGGGGGAVSSYTNSGNNRVITSVNSNTINGESNFTFDGSNMVMSDDTDAKANIGRAVIGYDGTNSDYATFAHRDMATNTNFALQQRANGTTVVNAKSGQSLSLRMGNANALVVAGASNNNVGINTGSPAARLHVSASSVESDVLRVDGVTTNINALYVSGSGKVGIGTGTPTAALHVSSSTSDPLFRVDHSTQAGSKPILFVTGSGLVGIGTDSPRADSGNTNRLHILAEEGADQGQNPVDNIALMLENNSHVGIQFMTPVGQSGQLVWGTSAQPNRARFYYNDNIGRFIYEDGGYGDSEVLTILKGGDSVNMGLKNSNHMGTNKAALHISSSTEGADVGGPVLLKVDHANQPGAQPTLFVTGSGRVGIGTEAPESTLEVRSTTTQQKWSYDDDHEFTITVADDGETVLAVSGTTVSPSPASDLVLDVSRGGDIFFRRAGDRLRFGISTGDTFIQTDNQNSDMSFRVHPNGGLGAVGTEVFRVDASGPGALLMSGTISSPGGDAPINFRDTATNIHSPGSNRLAITAPTLEVTGNLSISGAFGSHAVQTLTANAVISAGTGLTIIDASSSLAVNNSLDFTIENGTFVGQEKKITGIIISGTTGPESTGINIGGANIDSMPAMGGVGVIALTCSGPLGPVQERAGCVLVWGGTKWLPVGNFNFDINNTRGLFG